ncbi:MAG: universal stress protein [Elusimicrobiota bacterium]
MIFPVRRILVPDDFTPASRHTWAWARRFAAPDARLESLFVSNPPAAPVMGLPAPPLSPQATDELRARMRERRPDAGDWRVWENDPVAGILRRARRADFVVVGTHGRTGLSRAVFGSVAEAVMHSAVVPVLAVRTAPQPVKTVLAPVNLAEYCYKGLLLGAEAAAFLGAQLVLVHVSPKGRRDGNPRFFISGLIERLPAELRARVRPRLLIHSGDPIEVILAVSRSHGLTVLTAHRKSLLGDWVLGTTVERVIRHATGPVLAAPSA